MQTTIKKHTKQTSSSKYKKDNLTKDDLSKVVEDEKLKKGLYTITTPRNYMQKSTAADIYGQKKTATQNVKAPKKTPSASHLSSNSSPMKDLLKSSPSSSSQLSSRRESKVAPRKVEPKLTKSTVTPRNKDFNVTVNSPVVKSKLNLDRQKSFTKQAHQVTKVTEIERQRTKTRTLDENEVKILTPETVDNNAEMINLTKKLTAKPKAFYVDLDNKSTKKEPLLKTNLTKESSEDEISYEDDFESYESDFDSYHSSAPSDGTGDGEATVNVDGEQASDNIDEGASESGSNKGIKDDERMLDSGNFDLRDQRSSHKLTEPMAFILERSECSGEDKRVSLTDEGFQEMSSSSAVTSIKTCDVDVVLDRPLFIDFSKSKENKRKKRIYERLKQRANDLLNIITLHEMSYNLFEMKPVSYDLYMSMFGRNNYTQVAVQTFDDGITEEMQTDEIECEEKWTQHPVKFTKNDICVSRHNVNRRHSENTEDYLSKFIILTKQIKDVEFNNMNNLDDDNDYKSNPLRIYFEQKDGVGLNKMLPYAAYKSKLVENNYNTRRLNKFLKRIEKQISRILNKNSGNLESSDLIKSVKFPFSKGYIPISTKNLIDKKFNFLKNTKILQVYFSETKSDLVMTVHKINQDATIKNCVICLWNTSVVRQEPIKLLTAIDNVVIGRFRGATDGIFVAALEDGSIHLWDLSEEPMLRHNNLIDEKSTKLVEFNSGSLSDSEKEKELNLKNSQVDFEQNELHCALYACAYTSSAFNISNGEAVECIVGLELASDARTFTQDGGRKIVGQVVSLQRTGIITVWTIIQEKSKDHSDIGKAICSKMKLEKCQTINLLDYIDIPAIDDEKISFMSSNFNLDSAKRRLSNKKLEKNIVKKLNLPRKTAANTDFEFDIDRPASAVSMKKKVSQVKKYDLGKWESGILCNDLKIMNWKNDNNYLVAKNSGEVITCKKNLGAIKVDRFCVSSDKSSVTRIEVSPHGLPYFLAATDTGTVNLYSLLENRVLLTLDCRNIPIQDVDRCQSDHKGRYISSGLSRLNTLPTCDKLKMSVASLVWSRVNPCCLFVTLRDGATVVWELTQSDIYAKYAYDKTSCACVATDNLLALLTLDGEVQVHRLTNEQRTNEYLKLFERYVSLL